MPVHQKGRYNMIQDLVQHIDQLDVLPGGMDRKMALNRIGRSLKDLSREWQIINKLAS